MEGWYNSAARQAAKIALSALIIAIALEERNCD
jgi:hypothetical protein